ncbi:lipopolysaccharide assembly protein LapA domain-containing protein [Fodinibius saliphilus]|uniref:lipopolysaccharide assembly protein LapA domain-containing protein n=1 Tax=Fodinibius saliphilus TaxID=1920650 RepID=UPI001109EDBC|nr:LapA family protein [Fodinibius saliphilus]
MKKLKLSIALILILILILLVVQNTASVQAHFLGFTTEMSLVVLLFLTGALGFVSGLVLGFLLKNKVIRSTEEQRKN